MTDFSPAAFGPAALRVGTAEREQAAEALGKHFTAGRLDVTEYDDRVARAYAAKTVGDLNVLFTDLPQATPMRSAPPIQVAAQRQPSSVVLPLAIFGVLALGAVLVVVTHMVPFFVFPLVFFLFLRGRRGYGPRYGGGHYTRM